MSQRLRCILATLCVFGAVLSPSDARAQSIDSPYRFVETSQSLGLFGGYAFTGEGNLELGPQSAPIFGARFNIRVSGPFSAEGAVSWLQTKRTVWDTIPADTSLRVLGEADMSVLSVTAAMRFDLTGPRTWHRLQPYVALGGGVAFDLAGDADVEATMPEDVRFDFGTRFLGVVGGGVEAHVSRRITASFDARTQLWKLNTPEPFLFGEPGLYRPPDEWTQNLILSGSVQFRF